MKKVIFFLSFFLIGCKFCYFCCRKKKPNSRRKSALRTPRISPQKQDSNDSTIRERTSPSPSVSIRMGVVVAKTKTYNPDTTSPSRKVVPDIYDEAIETKTTPKTDEKPKPFFYEKYSVPTLIDVAKDARKANNTELTEEFKNLLQIRSMKAYYEVFRDINCTICT